MVLLNLLKKSLLLTSLPHPEGIHRRRRAMDELGVEDADAAYQRWLEKEQMCGKVRLIFRALLSLLLDVGFCRSSSNKLGNALSFDKSNTIFKGLSFEDLPYTLNGLPFRIFSLKTDESSEVCGK